MRAIVTRPAAQAQSWVEALRSRGVDAEALPLIGIAPAADASPVRSAWQALASYTLVVFVSPNAVEQFFVLAPEGAVWPSATLAGSPGPGTTSELRARGVHDSAIVEPRADAAQFDSESLWEQLAPVLASDSRRNGKALIVRGDGGREWLAQTLRDAGMQVELLASYRRTPPTPAPQHEALLAEALAEPAGYVWLFSSSEAIDHLAAWCASRDAAAWRRARAIATHSRIAERARAFGFGHVHEARPSLDAVVACIQSIGP